MKAMDGNNKETIEEEVHYEDYDTRNEIILQCYNALASVEMIDTYDKTMQRKKDRIRRKALDVIDYYINEIHAEIFDEDKEDE